MKKSNNPRRLFAVMLALTMVFTMSAIPINAQTDGGQIEGAKSTWQHEGDLEHPEDVYLIGQEVHYLLEITNTHGTESMEVDIWDVDPSGEEHVLATDEVILAGDTWTQDFHYTVGEDDLIEVGGVNAVRNRLFAEGDQGLEEVAVEVTKTSQVIQPDISVTKEADEFSKVGDSFDYIITVTNTGDWALEDITVYDELLGGDVSADFDEALEPGESTEATIEYTVQEGDEDPLLNDVVVEGTAAGFDPEIEGAVVADTDSVSVDLVNPEIEITKTADTDEGYVGDEIEYTIAVENVGDHGLENIMVTDPMFEGDITEAFDFNEPLMPGDSETATFYYTIQEGDLPGPIENTASVYSNPVGLPNDIEDEASATVAILAEELTVEKTAETSYTRTHEWDIDKGVETEEGLMWDEDETISKIWLYSDGTGNETATWNVDVSYEGYEDIGHNVSGTVTIENTGDGDVTINDVMDVLDGTEITVNFGVEFPYVLAEGETLEGTYSEDGEFEGMNVVTVTTERDEYTADAEIIWGDPAEELYNVVNIEDDSDLLGEQHLGTLDAVEIDEGEVTTFYYDHYFAWEDYDEIGPHIFENTATIVETGQDAEATLVVNWEAMELELVTETAWAYGNDEADDYMENNDVNGNSSNAWGWTNQVGDGVHYEFDLYAAAGQNDLEKGELVGTVVVHIEGEDSWVRYELDIPDYSLSEVHLWIGDTELPMVRRGRHGEVPTSAPGQFNYTAGLEENTTEYTFDFDANDYTDEDGNLWVAAHAVVSYYEVMEE